MYVKRKKNSVGQNRYYTLMSFGLTYFLFQMKGRIKRCMTNRPKRKLQHTIFLFENQCRLQAVCSKTNSALCPRVCMRER